MSEDELLLTHILKCTRADLLLHKPRLTARQHQKFESYKRRRKQGEPLQYILGSWDFCGLELKVDRRVLVPRPETEMLADLAIKRFKGSDILDLGTGSGNLAIVLAKCVPQAKVAAVDVSKEALSVARANARAHRVENRIRFVHQDMAAMLSQAAPQSFDLIVSNPPYIPSADLITLPVDVRQEPALALDGGPDGLNFYRTIIKYSPALLRTGGCLMMELGDGQAHAIRSLFSAQSKLTKIEIHPDLTQRDRIVFAQVSR